MQLVSDDVRKRLLGEVSSCADTDKVHVGAINACRSHHDDTENLAGDGSILAVNSN